MEQQKKLSRVIVLETKYEPTFSQDDVEENMKMQDFLQNQQLAPYKFQASNPKSQDKIIGSPQSNGFITAFRIAYQYHMPLELKPDHIWLTVCQGFATHIVQNSEELRKQFVDFDGKKTLRVDCDDFIFGSADNNWPEFFSQISDKIKEIIGQKVHDIFVHAFSTSTTLDKTVYQATLLSGMQKFFSYQICTACAIPKVKLLGTTEDWKNLREKISQIAKYDLKWWIQKLLPIIDKMVAAVTKGQADSHFWNSVYKIVIPDMSGAVSKVNGWICNFFPYVKSKRNKRLRDLNEVLETMKTFNPQYLDQGYRYGNLDKLSKEEIADRKQKTSYAIQIYSKYLIQNSKVPKGITKAPFIWKIDQEQKNMKLFSGFFGAELTQEGYIRPRIGWAVAQVGQEQTNIDDNNEEYDSDQYNSDLQ